MTNAGRLILTLGAVLAIAAMGCSQAPTATSTGPTTRPDATSGNPTQPAASVPGSTVAAAGPRACDLLTDADIQELGGVAVVSKTDNVMDTIYANHCRWQLEVGEINLGIVSPGGRTFYDTRLGIVNGLEPVEGLPADTAVLQELTGTIWAVKGDTLIDLFTIGVGAPDVELVRRVIQNLGG
jgi:hypothetical protein